MNHNSIRLRQWGGITLRTLLDTALIILFFLSLLPSGDVPANHQADPSWTQVLAHAFVEGWVFGRDIVFSFGPLGLLHPFGAYQTESYFSFIILQILLTLGASIIIVVFSRRLDWVSRFLFLAAILFPMSYGREDPVWFLTILLGGLLLISPPFHWTPRLKSYYALLFAEEQGETVLMLHAPGELSCHLEQPGEYTATESYGILSAAYQQGSSCPESSNGVIFSASLPAGELFQDYVNPFDHPEDQGTRQKTLTFQKRLAKSSFTRC